MQPDTLMQNLHKKIPRSKLLEQLKKQDECASAPSSPTNKTPDTAKKPPADRSSSTPRLSKPATAVRRSLAKTVSTNPKNTIRSMFEKQLEKSRLEQSLSSVDECDVLQTSPTQAIESISSKVEQIAISGNAADECTTTLAPGTAHKRLTRRNSMTIQTPTKTKTDVKPVESTALLDSRRKRRCTLFTPSLIDSIVEDDTVPLQKSPESNGSVNGTVLQSQAMDVCEKTNKTAEIMCNNKTWQLLNADISQTTSTPASKQLTLDAPCGSNKSTATSRLRRQTMYTPQAMDETDMLGESVATKSSTASQQRRTINVNATQSLSRSVFGNPPELESTKSCDAVLTPTNKANNGNSYTSLIYTIQCIVWTPFLFLRLLHALSLALIWIVGYF